MNQQHNILISESDISLMVENTIHNILLEIAAGQPKGTLFHFTSFKLAFNIMKNNEIYLSQTFPGRTDFKLGQNNLCYLSFTRDGNIQTSQYPIQRNSVLVDKLNVRFSFNSSQLNSSGFKTIPVDYMRVKADSLMDRVKNNGENTNSYKKQFNFFKKLGLKDDFSKKELDKIVKDTNTKETRLISNKTKITNLTDFVNVVDILVTPEFLPKMTINSVAKSLENLDLWKNKIRIFNNVNDFDKGVNFTTIDEVLKTNNKELTPKEAKWLKSTEKVELTTTSLFNAAKSLYLMNFTNNGLSKIKASVNKSLASVGLIGYNIVLVDDDKTKHTVQFNTIINKLLDNVHDEYLSGKIDELYTKTRTAFDKSGEYFRHCKFIQIGLTTLYINWLIQYKKAVDNKLSAISDEINRIKTVTDLIGFAKKNVFIFQKLVSNYLQTNQIDKFSDYLTNNIYEYKLKGSTNNFVNNIMTLLNKIDLNQIKKEFFNIYRNTFYHYDEMLIFKRSVMMYKNNLITSVRKKMGATKSRVGDLAVLYNNADLANQENNL